MEGETSALSFQDRVAGLEAKQTELLALVESKENEFGKKRAQFKDLFLQKETELNNEITNARLAKEENASLLAELKDVLEERDNLKTVVLITQTSNDEKLNDMEAKYQEEITSLKAIMHDAVQETRQEASMKYKEEQQGLIKANIDLSTKLTKCKEKLKVVKLQAAPNEEDDNDGLFDVLSTPWKKTSDVQQEDHVKESEENLEDSMKKAQENAETLRSIVMPLEQEIATLRSKLKNANDKINNLESKEKKQARQSQNDLTGENSQTTPAVNVEELREKIKELSQYLEAERSSRTDLEMFVAVLNTQKGVLQEDADKLKRELHNVCRLLEQEKEEHVALKDTWEMANDRFLATQRIQRKESDRIRQILTTEQQNLLTEQSKNDHEKVELLSPPSPSIKHRYFHRKTGSKNKKVASSEPRRTLSSLVRGGRGNASILDADIPTIDTTAAPLVPMTPPTVAVNDHPSTSTPNDVTSLVDMDHIQATFSDSENHVSFNDTHAMRKYKSADDLKSDVNSTPTMTSRSKSHDFEQSNFEKSSQLEDFVEKYGRAKIDLKNFEEAAKSSLSNESDQLCAMCSNYEKQLQNLQAKNEELLQATTDLSKQLKDEHENVIVVKRAHERLEQSVKMASEDAQAQIQAAFDTQRDLETILEEVSANMDKTRRDAAEEMKTVMESRDSLMARCEQLAENYTNLQSKSQTREAMEQSEAQAFDAVSKTKIDKLQSDIHFMKDRIMAEQVAKENLEEFFQGDINNLQSEIKKLHKELETEKQQNREHGHQQQPQQPFVSTNSNEVIAVLEKQLQQGSKEKDELVKRMQELKSQIYSLNGQLNSSESVQRDFVRLSQSLQMELVEIKESQKEIKWEHEDDVNSCRKCERRLEEAQHKHHCNQCGRIFCDSCSSKTTSDADSPKPLRVCLDCHDVIRGHMIAEDKRPDDDNDDDDKKLES